MSNALLDELNRLAKKQKDEGYNMLLAVLHAAYEAEKRQIIAKSQENGNIFGTRASNTSADLELNALHKNNAREMRGFSGNAPMEPVSAHPAVPWLPRKNADGTITIEYLDDFVQRQDTTGQERGRTMQAQDAYVDPVTGYWVTPRKRKNNALLNALDEAERQQSISTGNVYDAGAFGYAVNTIDPTGNDYQTNLALSAEQIREYFKSIGGAGNITATEHSDEDETVSRPTHRPTVTLTYTPAEKVSNAISEFYSCDDEFSYVFANLIIEACDATYNDSEGYEYGVGANFETGEVTEVKRGENSPANTADMFRDFVKQGYNIALQIHPILATPNMYMGDTSWRKNYRPDIFPVYLPDEHSVINSTSNMQLAWELKDELDYFISVMMDENGDPYAIGIIDIAKLAGAEDPSSYDFTDARWASWAPPGAVTTIILN